jgi:hypothetical protein
MVIDDAMGISRLVAEKNFVGNDENDNGKYCKENTKKQEELLLKYR